MRKHVGFPLRQKQVHFWKVVGLAFFIRDCYHDQWDCINYHRGMPSIAKGRSVRTVRTVQPGLFLCTRAAVDSAWATWATLRPRFNRDSIVFCLTHLDHLDTHTMQMKATTYLRVLLKQALNPHAASQPIRKMPGPHLRTQEHPSDHQKGTVWTVRIPLLWNVIRHVCHQHHPGGKFLGVIASGVQWVPSQALQCFMLGLLKAHGCQNFLPKSPSSAGQEPEP